jgi:hypothetical protein
MLAFICLILGFLVGYVIRGLTKEKPVNKVIRRYSAPLTYQQKLQLKSQHQNDSDRIRELNELSRNQSVFLRLLKQTFINHDIAIKQQRFIILDRNSMPCAIFEYRDGTHAIKLMDHEDELPLYLYKGLISGDELKQDYLNIILGKK